MTIAYLCKIINDYDFYLDSHFRMSCVKKTNAFVGKDDLEVILEGITMANNYQIKYIDSPENLKNNPPEKVKADIEKILLEINRQMSIYQESSEISQFNRDKSLELIKISDDFATVVSEAMRIAKLTKGGLDITLAPIIDLWGFGSGKPAKKVDEFLLNQCLHYVGMDKISLFHQDGRYYLKKHHPNVSIDLCAIAKGFGVDKIAYYLDEQGVSHYLVDIGGELRCHGVNAHNQNWSIGIETPDNSQTIYEVVSLSNKALATSANYRNFYVNEQGEKLCHIIDYQTYQPTRSDIVSLSVIADNCMTADGLATALLVLGKDNALKLAEKENLAVYIITINENGQFKPHLSTFFQKYLNHQ